VVLQYLFWQMLSVLANAQSIMRIHCVSAS